MHQGDTTGPNNSGLVFPEGNIAHPQMSNEATDGLATSVFDNCRAQLERILAFFRQRTKKTRARNRGFGFASFSRGLVFPDGDVAELNFNTDLDPSLEYSTDNVVLFWPHPIFHRGPLGRLS